MENIQNVAKLFICQYCPLSFRTYSTLKIHLTTHSNVDEEQIEINSNLNEEEIDKEKSEELNLLKKDNDEEEQIINGENNDNSKNEDDLNDVLSSKIEPETNVKNDLKENEIISNCSDETLKNNDEENATENNNEENVNIILNLENEMKPEENSMEIQINGEEKRMLDECLTSDLNIDDLTGVNLTLEDMTANLNLPDGPVSFENEENSTEIKENDENEDEEKENGEENIENETEIEDELKSKENNDNLINDLTSDQFNINEEIVETFKNGENSNDSENTKKNEIEINLLHIIDNVNEEQNRIDYFESNDVEEKNMEKSFSPKDKFKSFKNKNSPKKKTNPDEEEDNVENNSLPDLNMTLLDEPDDEKKTKLIKVDENFKLSDTDVASSSSSSSFLPQKSFVNLRSASIRMKLKITLTKIDDPGNKEGLTLNWNNGKLNTDKYKSIEKDEEENDEPPIDNDDTKNNENFTKIKKNVTKNETNEKRVIRKKSLKEALNESGAQSGQNSTKSSPILTKIVQKSTKIVQNTTKSSQKSTKNHQNSPQSSPLFDSKLKRKSTDETTEEEKEKEPSKKRSKIDKSSESGADEPALKKIEIKTDEKQAPKLFVKKNALICQFCQKVYKHSGHFKTHLLEHEKIVYECEKCPEKFDLKIDFENHFTSTHKKISPVIFKCEICDKIFSRETLLRAHSLTHAVKEIKCKSCHECFRYVEALKYHVKIHHFENTGETIETRLRPKRRSSLKTPVPDKSSTSTKKETSPKEEEDKKTMENNKRRLSNRLQTLGAKKRLISTEIQDLFCGRCSGKLKVHSKKINSAIEHYFCSVCEKKDQTSIPELNLKRV